MRTGHNNCLFQKDVLTMLVKSTQNTNPCTSMLMRTLTGLYYPNPNLHKQPPVQG